MSITWDDRNKRWRWHFKKTIAGRSHRHSRLLPKGWSAAQAKKYDEKETAATYASIHNGRPVAVPYVVEAVALFLEERLPQMRDSVNTGHNLQHLLPYYTGRGLDELPAICREYARDNRHLAPATIRQRLQSLRSAAVYALKQHDVGDAGWIAAMSFPQVGDNARKEYMTRAEVLRLCRAMKDKEARAWALMTYYTGWRPRECQRAAVDNGRLTKLLKNGDVVADQVPTPVRRYLRYWPMPWAYRWYYDRFITARDAAGLDSRLVPHSLRHSTGTAIVQAGGTTYDVQKYLNQKSVASAERYAHFAEERKEAIFQQIRTHKQKRNAA